MDVKNTIFQAIHTPISFNANSSGKVLFHNHLTGNASRIDNPKITTTAIVAKPTVLVNVSIIFQDLQTSKFTAAFIALTNQFVFARLATDNTHQFWFV